jgi:hypothetical protein
MSIEDVTNTSEVSVLIQTQSKASNMDLTRSFAVDRTVACRCVAASSREVANMKMRAMDVSNVFYFGVDPGIIDETNRLMVGEVLYRPVGALINVHELDRMWKIYADKRSRDNELVEIL